MHYLATLAVLVAVVYEATAMGSVSNERSLHSRKGRFIDFPSGSGFEVKWSLNYPFQSYTNYKTKFQLALPIFIKFPKDKYKNYKRSIDYSDNEVEEYTFDRENSRGERLLIYRHFVDVANAVGLNGTECMLRAVCEVAEIPFEQGLLGDLINTIMTASGAAHLPHEIGSHDYRSYNPYVEAEKHGYHIGECEQKYHLCSRSIFDLLPHMDQMVNTLFDDDDDKYDNDDYDDLNSM